MSTIGKASVNLKIRDFNLVESEFFGEKYVEVRLEDNNENLYISSFRLNHWRENEVLIAFDVCGDVSIVKAEMDIVFSKDRLLKLAALFAKEALKDKPAHELVKFIKEVKGNEAPRTKR